MAVDELVIKWSMDSKNFNDGIAKMNKSMNLLKSEFGATSNRLKVFGTATEQLKNKQEYLNNAMQIQKQKCEALKKSYDKQVEATGANSKEAENLAIKLNNAVGYYNKLEGELKQTNEELDRQSSKWPKISQHLDTVGNKLTTFGSKLNGLGNKLTLGLTTPIIGAGAASFNLASDMQESLNKVEATFEDSSQSILDWSKTTLESYGIASVSALEYASSVGDILKGIGFSKGQIGDMSKEIVSMSADIASFKNSSPQEVFNAITAAMTGEYEQLKKYGYVINESILNEYAKEKGLKKTTKEMTLQEKALLSLSKIQDYAKDAAGDFAKTSDGAANQQRIFTESLKEVGATMGEHLLPIGTELITKVNDMIKKFGSLDEGTQKNIINIGLFAAALGPAMKFVGIFSSGLGSTIKFTKSLSEGFVKLKNSTMVTTIATKAMTIAQGALNFVMELNPITLVIAGLVALGATFAVLYSKCEWFRDGVDKVWSTITGVFQKFDNFLKGVFTTDWTQSFGVFGNVLNAFFTNCSNIWESIKRIFSGIIDFVVGVFTLDWARAWEGVKNIFGSVMNGLGAVIKAPLNAVIGLINTAISQLNKISFTVPSWIPIVGGKHFGVNLPKINYLYKGGIIDTPTLINGNTVVGDSYKGLGRQAEVVAPLGQLYSNIRDIVRQENDRNTIIYTTNVFSVDGKELKRETTKEVIKNINRSTNNYRKSKGSLVYV